MKRYIKYIVAFLLFAVIFCCYYFQGAHLLYFFEQHYLFRWTTEYWTTMAHLRGWTYPIEAFIVQFSYYPALGAAVWALIFTLEYLMLQSIVYRLSGFRDLLQLTVWVPMWLFSTTLSVDAPPTTPVQWFVWTFAVWVVAMAVGRFLPWIRRAKPVAESVVADSTDGEGKKEVKKSHGCVWLWASPALALIFMGLSYNLWSKEPLTNDIAEAERTMLATERAIRERRWDDALHLANGWAATGRKNHLMSYFRSLALYHTGNLYEHLFDYPQTFGIRSLFFPWLGDKNQAEYGHYVFQDLGHLTEAQRWVFEAMVGWTETAPLLNYLVEYNIAIGRPRVADKFLVMLEQTLFYRDRARFLRSCLDRGEVPGLRWALADAPSEPARWNNMLNVGGEASFILVHDPDNEMARQYLMTGMLLVNNPEAVFRTLERIYPADEHPELPRIVQEALLMYRLSYGHAAINALGYNISEENEKRFRDYMTESAKGKKAHYTPDQRRSYWYYVEHVFPKVNHDFTRNKKPQVQS